MSPQPMQVREMRIDRFAERVRQRAPLCGAFIKTPCAQHAEIAGLAGLDFAVFDTEHALFSAAELDRCMLGARVSGLPAVVRLADNAPHSVLRALDAGAQGVLVPHVTSAGQARSIVASARYRDGTRGFSNSPRAGEYGGRSMSDHIERSDRETTVLCQIEDREAVDAIDEIASVPGIDCLFLGRADLAVSYRTFDPAHKDVLRAVERVADAGCRYDVPVGIFIGEVSAVSLFASLGVSLFVIGSDQSVLRAGLANMGREFAAQHAHFI
jgi:2-keto-3-deoxy-L-rhamnonate aldolase RhmA